MKKNTCNCFRPIPNVPFQIGDKVVMVDSHYHDPKHFVRTVTSVRPYEKPYKSPSGNMIYSSISTDGGPLCKECNKPLRGKRTGFADAWFREATKEDIKLCSEYIRNLIK